MDELNELRKKRMLELMKAQQHNTQVNEELQMAEALAVMEKEIRNYLDDKAYDRLNNIKLINKDMAVKAIYLLYQLKTTGRLVKKLSDEEFKKLLLQIMPKKREPRIMRR